MKKLIFIAIFSSIVASCFAQIASNTYKNSKYVLRSTIGINGLSKAVETDSKTFFIQQSIGQASVIGTYSNKNYTVRQGFLQPLNSTQIQSINSIESNLSASIFPNPFHQSINISFDDFITKDLFVEIYNMSGRLVFSERYSASQQIDIPLNYLPEEIYVLKITTENKQLVKKLIKR